MALHSAGAKIFAVGDPDQCVYEFSGARPSTVMKLVNSPDFHAVTLKYNYRSGATLIDAAQTALSQVRTFEADPDRTDPGAVVLQRCRPGLRAHAKVIATETVPQLVASGVPLHEIAILYPGRGQLIDLIRSELEDAGIPFSLERESAFPSVPIVTWLQRCCAFALSPLGSASESLTELSAGLLHLRTGADPFSLTGLGYAA